MSGKSPIMPKLPQIKRTVRIILRNIFDCSVKLQRLTSDEIEAATKHGYQHDVELTPNMLRNYLSPAHLSDESSISNLSSAVSSPIIQLNGVLPSTTAGQQNHLHTDDHSSDCSSDYWNDSDSDDESGDSKNDANGEYSQSPYPINLEDISSLSPPKYVVIANGNGITNGVDTLHELNNRDSGFCEGSEQLPKMYEDYMPNLSPNVDDDNDDNDDNNDGDEDLRFLNGLEQMLNQLSDTNGTSGNRDENGRIWAANRIFNNVCLKFLRDECYNPYCDYEHTLPTAETVSSRLNTATRREIDEVQNKILLRHDMLMTNYFGVFCKFYGRKWQMHRENLRLLISVLSTRPLATVYMKDILNGFLISDMKYSTCVNLLLLEIDDSLDMTEKFNILWDIIIDVRNDSVHDHLKGFETVLLSEAHMNADAITKIIDLQIKDALECLRDFVVNLVKRCRLVTFKQIDEKVLKNYIWHVRWFDLSASRAIQQRAAQFGIEFESSN